MFDVTFKSVVVSDRQAVDQYAAQDLETQLVGLAVPFTYDFNSGFVSLGYDFITDTASTFNGFDSQDMEALAVGVITALPGNTSSSLPPVALLTGNINPAVPNIGDEDMEIYAANPSVAITQLSNPIYSGDITMRIAYIRTFP